MSYMWDNFNIKTFPAETIVYRDGNYDPDISTLPESDNISEKYELPVHVIYTGQIERENTLNLNLNVSNQPVFLTVNIKNEFPAFLNIFIKNSGKNSEIRGHILLKNSSDLCVKIIAEHYAPDTGILLQTKIIGEKNSYSKISGAAIINQNCEKCRSNLTFSGYGRDKSAKIRFIPSQKIKSIPDFAEHSAYLFNIKDQQEDYLRMAGLSGAEVKDIMIEAFQNDFNLF